jgi:amino acid adenylation domain-containing protein
MTSGPDSRIVETFPASAGQERLWLLEQAAGGTAAYAVPIGYHVERTLSPERFESAVRAVVSRHDILRTGLVWDGGRLVQRVARMADPPTTFLVRVGLDDFRAALQQAATEPFDLSQPPLLRCIHAALSGGRTGLGFAFHHAICDSWSLELFMRDLTCVLAGHQLDGAAGSYGRWALEEQQWFRTPEADLDRDYWRRRIGGGAAPLEIGHGVRRRPRRGAVHHFDVPARTVDRLVRETAATSFAIMLAAFAALLRRYSINESISIGLPIAGRTSPDAERTLGYLSNTVVLIEDYGESTTFRMAIVSALRHVTEGLEHGRLPFQEIVRVVQARRDADPPLYQAMFGPQNTPVETALEVDGRPLRPVRIHNGTAKRDLTLLVEAEQDRMHCELEYATDLFDSGWADRFCGGYVRLIASAADAPDARIDELPLLAPEDLPVAFAERADASAYDHEQPAHRAVEKQVVTTPDAVAVSTVTGAITYRQLGGRANALAHQLIRLGSGHGGRVGILLDRGADLICAVLGTLKAGAAFVPLDRRLPKARIAAICGDAGISALITDTDHACDLAVDLVNGSERVAVLVPSEETEDAPPAVEVDGSDLAYIYYTSGSTGLPKGSPIDHRCVMTRLAYLRDHYPLTPGEAVLHKTPLIFDIAIWEIFLPLFVGGTVVVLEPGKDNDGAHIAHLLQAEPIALVHFVPSAMDAYLGCVESREYQRLRWVILSGEAVTADLMRRARDHFGTAVHSQYGQTETSEVTLWRGPGVERGRGVERAGATILGYPVGAYSLYVVDPILQSVPPDVPGELCVSGSGGLAWGYLNRPALTAERFVPHPHPSEAGQRLYRTGDLARVVGSGLIEYLGRVDQQLKVRGCRVEPGEIESLLCRHPAVSGAAVVVRPSSDGERHLVAYVTCSGDLPSPGALADHVRAALPWFMLPSAFVALAKFPRTMSGKIDRDRLPAPGRDAFVLSTATVEPPVGDLESAVAAEWSRVLDIPDLSRSDDFFLVGGTSLGAVRVLAALGKHFGVELSIAEFVRRPTIAALATCIADRVQAMVSSLSEGDVDRLLRSLRDDELEL